MQTRAPRPKQTTNPTRFRLPVDADGTPQRVLTLRSHSALISVTPPRNGPLAGELRAEGQGVSEQAIRRLAARKGARR